MLAFECIQGMTAQSQAPQVCLCEREFISVPKHRKTPSKLTKSTACVPRGNHVASHGRKTSGSMLFDVALWYFFVFVCVVCVSQLILTKQMERGWYNGSGGVCPLLMTLSQWQVWWPHSGGPDQTQTRTFTICPSLNWDFLWTWAASQFAYYSYCVVCKNRIRTSKMYPYVKLEYQRCSNDILFLMNFWYCWSIHAIIVVIVPKVFVCNFYTTSGTKNIAVSTLCCSCRNYTL